MTQSWVARCLLWPVIGSPGVEVGGTYGLVLVDWVLDAAGVLGHPGGVEHGHAGHAQDGGGQGEVYTGRRDLRTQQRASVTSEGAPLRSLPCYVAYHAT